MSDIKAMGLYRDVERILADLDASGLGADAALQVDDLTPFDQYHYESTDAVDDAIAELNLGPSSRVLDIGSGLGGPARYIADRTGSRVTALELQPDLHATAATLTERCELDDWVTHVHGNVLDGAVAPDSFDAIVSMLCFLHIPDRDTLFARCAEALEPGGLMYIDDYVERGELTDREREILATKVHCAYLPNLSTYVGQVEAAGFVVVRTIDKTDAWTRFVTDRLEQFQSRRAELVDRYGTETVDSLDDFYSAVVNLFAAGRLGGLRMVARLLDDD
ncbi:MAG: SAM-dependent methyltransferase [Acidimicrobiales bacterium]